MLAETGLAKSSLCTLGDPKRGGSNHETTKRSRLVSFKSLKSNFRFGSPFGGTVILRPSRRSERRQRDLRVGLRDFERPPRIFGAPKQPPRVWSQTEQSGGLFIKKMYQQTENILAEHQACMIDGFGSSWDEEMVLHLVNTICHECDRYVRVTCAAADMRTSLVSCLLEQLRQVFGAWKQPPTLCSQPSDVQTSVASRLLRLGLKLISYKLRSFGSDFLGGACILNNFTT